MDAPQGYHQIRVSKCSRHNNLPSRAPMLSNGVIM
jgi:hypothetical protein